MIFGGLLGVWLVICGAGSVWFARSNVSISPGSVAFFAAASIAIGYMFATVWWMIFGALTFAPIVVLSLVLIGVSLGLLTQSPKRIDLSFGTFVLAVLSVVAVVWVLKADSHQHFGFDTWDAVVSWNRWATELVDDKFFPYPNPYPILWPTLWSVIYAAQSAELWQVLTKNLHLVLVVIASLICWDLWRRRNAAAALIFMIAMVLSTGQILNKFTWGYMDQPVALLIGMGILAFFLTRDDDAEKPKDHLQIWLLPFWLFGIAAVTKQAGWPLIGLGLIVMAYDYFKGRVSWKAVALGLLGLLGPVLVFAFFFSEYKQAVMGTSAQIENLMSLSANRTQIDDVWGRGLALFLSINSVADFIRLASLFLMTFAVFFLRGRERLILALTAVLAIVGSIGTGICCSYDDRNAGWLLTLSIAGLSGAVASAKWPQRLKQTKIWQPVSTRFEAGKALLLQPRWSMDRRVFAVFVPIALVSAAIIETGSKDYIAASNNVMRNLGGYSGAKALFADLERTDGCRTIYAAHDMVRQNPILTRYKRRIRGGGNLNWYLNSGRSIDPKCQTYWYLKPGVYPQASQEDKELFLQLQADGKVIHLDGYAYRVTPGATW